MQTDKNNVFAAKKLAKNTARITDSKKQSNMCVLCSKSPNIQRPIERFGTVHFSSKCHIVVPTGKVQNGRNGSERLQTVQELCKFFGVAPVNGSERIIFHFKSSN